MTGPRPAASERVTLPVDPRPVRRRLGRRHGGPSTASTMLYRLYLVALASLPPLAIVLNIEADPAAGADAVTAVAAGAPVGLALLLLGVGQLSTWAGPVVPERGEVAWVLTAPIDRTRLLRPRLATALGVFAAAGALVLYVPALVLIPDAPGPAHHVLGTAVGVGALLGLLGGALGWLVECSQPLARAMVRRRGLALVLVAGAGGIGFVEGVPRAIVTWSGPWGWASRLLVAGAGGTTSGWPVAAGLLASFSLGAGGVALYRAGSVPHEELERRSGPLTSVKAALFLLDLRSATELRRSAVRQLAGSPRRRWLPRPRRAVAAIPWMDGVTLVRAPGWLALALATAVLAALLADVPVVRASVWGGTMVLLVLTVGGYLVASRVLMPLRTEDGYPFADRHLPLPAESLARRHLVAPATALVLCCLLGGAATLAVGRGPAEAAGGTVLALLAAPVLLGCAAVAATSPPPDLAMMALGDLGAMSATGRATVGPLVAVVGVYLPGVLALRAVAEGASTPEVLGAGVLWSGLVSALTLGPALRRIRHRDG